MIALRRRPDEQAVEPSRVHEHTVGKWRRRFLKARIEGLSDEPRGRERSRRSGGQGLSTDASARRWRSATHWSSSASAGFRTRRSGWHLRLRLAAAPLGDVQAVGRSAHFVDPLTFIDCRRRTCAGALRRREEPDPGGSTHTAGRCRCCRACLSGARTITSATEPFDPRCRAGLPSSASAGATSAREFLDFLTPTRSRRADIHIVGQLRHPQDGGSQSLAGTAAALACPLYADVGVLDQSVERWFAELTRKQLQRGVHTSTRQLEADIRACTTKTPSPSSGPNRPTTSSPPSSASASVSIKIYAANFRFR